MFAAYKIRQAYARHYELLADADNQENDEATRSAEGDSRVEAHDAVDD